ncbi:hypothetical protein [Undibacterium terreum]|nr:hypothetical protein [Undibacterium terreum]
MAKTSEASVKEMQRQSEAALRPYVNVSAFIRPNTPILYLRIVNTGRTPAENLRLEMDRDFFQFGETQVDKNLRNKSAFTTPMDSLPPDSELLFALGQGWVIFGNEAKLDLCPTQFTVAASYEFSGKKIDERHNIDLRGYLGSEGEHDPLVEELERIRNVIEKKK